MMHKYRPRRQSCTTIVRTGHLKDWKDEIKMINIINRHQCKTFWIFWTCVNALTRLPAPPNSRCFLCSRMKRFEHFVFYMYFLKQSKTARSAECFLLSKMARSTDKKHWLSKMARSAEKNLSLSKMARSAEKIFDYLKRHSAERARARAHGGAKIPKNCTT